MKKTIWILLFFIFIGQVQFIYAENEQMTKNKTFSFLKEAFLTQLSLGDHYRTFDEVSDVLSPYFTNDYQQLFLNEHIFVEPEGYIMYGTDVMFYFIPDYSFDANTKMLTSSNKIIIYEYFLPQFEGSVIWEKPHYKAITIIKTKSGWKISDYSISLETPKLNAQ